MVCASTRSLIPTYFMDGPKGLTPHGRVVKNKFRDWGVENRGIILCQTSFMKADKGPSINYVASKSAIFDPSPPPMSSFLLSRVYM